VPLREPPTDVEVARPLAAVRRRIIRLVARHGINLETAQCEPPLSCIDEVCTANPAPAPALTPVWLIVAVMLLAAVAAVGVWRRR
jgi:MYXO-CTERM domain-containing protein